MTDAKEKNRCKYCNEVIMGDFHKEEDCAMKENQKEFDKAYEDYKKGC